MGFFGFQYLLLFVLATIPSGIVSKLQYSETLANCDWLHGGAELLLTLTSLLVVSGFRDASVTGGIGVSGNELKIQSFALAVGAAFFAAVAWGPGTGLEAHSAFAGGIGDLGQGIMDYLPEGMRAEPE
ncbi:hypothetical protein TrRE_jg2840, partial [Triparma retinervis]